MIIFINVMGPLQFCIYDLILKQVVAKLLKFLQVIVRIHPLEWILIFLLHAKRYHTDKMIYYSRFQTTGMKEHAFFYAMKTFS